MTKKGRRKKLSAKKRRKRNSWLVLLFSLLLLGGLFLVAKCDLLHLRDRAPAHIPDGYNAFCIDISHHNGTVRDWDHLRIHVKADGTFAATASEAAVSYPVTMIYMKATEGVSMRDRRFPQQWKEARKRAFSVGAYHFFLSDKDPKAQAENYIRTVGPLRERDLAPVLDVESTHKGCTREQLNRAVRIWLEAVEAYYGKKPIIYTSDHFARRMLSPELTASYRIWIAHYDVAAPSFAGWSLWQFTDRGRVEGIDGAVDISVERN